MKKLIIFLILMININLFASLKYEDITPEHWAYTSIESLVDKGIIVQDTFKFNGKSPISRYDFAVDLTRTLDYINLQKANKIDLNILESLMLEFSDEINKIGYDANTFNARLNSTNESIELLRARIKDNELTIQELTKRVEALENKIN